MRVVLVTHFYPAHGGGVEAVAQQLATRMAAQGAQLTWFASDTDAPPELPGVRCEPVAASNVAERLSGFPYPLWGPRSLARLGRCIEAADAVHVHDCIYYGSLAAASRAAAHRKKLVVTQHIGPVPLPLPLRPALWAMNRLGARQVLRRAQAVAFISPAVQRYFERIAGHSPRFHHVANGVDTRVFHPGAGAGDRAALGFDPQRPLLLFVGRFVPKKRLPLLRQMAALTPQWQWCVIGHGPEDPRAWGLPNVRVVAAMPQQALVDYYRAADLLVLPSHGEGFPLVVQEAMSCGLPACITRQVAAGGDLPHALWLELPEAGGDTAARGVALIAQWLASPAPAREHQRRECANHAAAQWDWDAAARSHLQWMQEPAP